MNKIFKIIWSKARNCYVVVSELAKSHDDGHVRRSRSGCCRKAAVLAAFVLTSRSLPSRIGLRQQQPMPIILRLRELLKSKIMGIQIRLRERMPMPLTIPKAI